jgi:pyruvate-formate lyase-activating enzyme
MTLFLDHNKYYRLPWNLPDNAISWLEVTKACNMYCEGCYRENDPKGHKSLDEIRHELEIFKKYRKTDGISLAGGDPLVHPDIVGIVRLIAQYGLKPIINTNGIALTKELLQELKKAGAVGFTLHVDSKQHRPHWKGKTEVELNPLRLSFAELLAEAGGLSCAFNSTVYGDTLQSIPDIVEWGQKHIDIVHVLVFIAFRAAVLEKQFDYYAGGEKIDMGPVVYSTPKEDQRLDILSNDIVEVIRTKYPDFEPCAYLNGTEKPDSFKWLLSGRIGTKKNIYGYVGPKFMELAQIAHHFRHGKYLAYTKPSVQRHAKPMLLLAPLDHGIRGVAKKYLRSVGTNPFNLFKRLHLQSITIIQPGDILCDGTLSMCDGCPDITVWNDQLVWSCRLEEQIKFGCFMRAVPKNGVRNQPHEYLSNASRKP